MNRPDLTGFDALLFDMNGTFVFGHDRFGDDQDYHKTYSMLGGRVLSARSVNNAVSECCRDMSLKYRDPAWYDRFPSVPDELATVFIRLDLPASEVPMIANVIAHHEKGDIPESALQALKALSRSHRMGVVSDIWCHKHPWLELLEHRGVLGLFETLVFSSDGDHVKPSPAMFQRALDALGVGPDRTLFVGDNPVRDIQPAAKLGMKTVLVGSRREAGIEADWNLPTIADLVP